MVLFQFPSWLLCDFPFSDCMYIGVSSWCEKNSTSLLCYKTAWVLGRCKNLVQSEGNIVWGPCHLCLRQLVWISWHLKTTWCRLLLHYFSFSLLTSSFSWQPSGAGSHFDSWVEFVFPNILYVIILLLLMCIQILLRLSILLMPYMLTKYSYKTNIRLWGW